MPWKSQPPERMTLGKMKSSLLKKELKRITRPESPTLPSLMESLTLKTMPGRMKSKLLMDGQRERMMLAKLRLQTSRTLLSLKMMQENAFLKSLSGKTLGVYFNAYRTKAYDGGGEENLTFQGTYCNVGGGLDTDTGIFTCP